MPIYEYICTACDHRADILHGINDPGPHFCPSCGREGTMKKVFAAPAIHYKGSGWAKKDRSATSRSAKSTSRSETESGSDKKDGGTTDKGGSTDKGTASEGSSTTTTPSTGSD